MHLLLNPRSFCTKFLNIVPACHMKSWKFLKITENSRRVHWGMTSSKHLFSGFRKDRICNRPLESNYFLKEAYSCVFLQCQGQPHNFLLQQEESFCKNETKIRLLPKYYNSKSWFKKLFLLKDEATLLQNEFQAAVLILLFFQTNVEPVLNVFIAAGASISHLLAT